MTQLSINGQPVEVPAGTTVLRAAEKLGITIPTLCDHPDLTPYGGCRLCLVQIKGARGLAASCGLPATEGMEVTTESDEIFKARRDMLELLLFAYHDSGYQDGQKEETQFMHWVRHFGLDPVAKASPEPRYPVDSDPNPVVWVDRNKCILCARCIRACEEIQGRFVWGLTNRGFAAEISAGANTDMLSARCESCGACVAYCPTGALAVRRGRAVVARPAACEYTGVCELICPTQAIQRPLSFGLNANAYTSPVCPRSVCSNLPVCTSQNLIVRSRLPVISVQPSRNAIVLTRPV